MLEQVDLPEDLRLLDMGQLQPLADELREFLVESVSRTGGHLAAGLGVVELTVALHYVFDTPRDKLVWDVGHQAYPHKILTGRRERMAGLRQKGGLSGFLKCSESEYDAFGAGHSSTSIGAALGMAVAAKQEGIQREHIAVIGDGALSAGMAFEALNHAGALDMDLLVVLNDNDMSISNPVGAVSNYLARVLSSRFYNRVREGGKNVLGVMPGMRNLVDRWEEHMKGMLIPGTLFEELGFNYIGPIDGHDLPLMVQTLRNMKQMRGPRFLHVVTQKGRGFAPAEGDPCVYHGVGPFDPDTGQQNGSGSSGKTYTQVFSDWICGQAAEDERLLAITPAMCEGSGLVQFATDFPRRYFDVGIAEQHAVTLAAGMACDGLKPVVAIYSTFLQRAYDQLIHDVALQNLDVTFAVDRAGLVGADGATHAGAYDLSYVRCIPNMSILAPADENECHHMLQAAWEHPGPAMVRYPRGKGTGVEVEAGQALPWGKGEIRREGQRVALLCFGSMLATGMQVAEALDATVVNMRFVKPLDVQLLQEMAASHELLVTLEENALMGGAGSAVAEALNEKGIQVPLLPFGLPDRYLEQGTQREQLEMAGLTAGQILPILRERLGGL
ncbi:1-deoxy-D-xylulose 5-phosphate synthase [Thiolapillus brandeum]|uniref:1-deoxy-D-xylulose-5-phosphate synthase n=1 Tax=Thiolapillus brandeum TaxID=1076588 RepID=A0A7U6GH60_9GAMM|nr:1-deoxy-D-xylulose 5-phosphate synthase [Thiolapillus brandeum]